MSTRFGTRRVLRALSALGAVLMLAALARPAYAHENIGGDELSMAMAIFIAGMVALVGAVIALICAVRTGQFENVEEPKYRMLENAPDLDDLPIFGYSQAPRPRQKQQPGRGRA